MVERDQVKPLAPSVDHPTSDEEETIINHRDKTNLRQKKCIKICVFIAVPLLVLAIIIIILMFTIFKIKNPVINLNRVTINQLNVGSTNSAGSVSNMSLTAEVSVKNPNVASFKYGNTTTRLYYGGTMVIGEARGPGGQARARRTMRMNITVDVMTSKILSDPNLQSDLSRGLIPISSYTKVGGRVKMLSFIRRHINVVMNCSVMINVTSQAIQQQKCNRKVEL